MAAPTTRRVLAGASVQNIAVKFSSTDTPSSAGTKLVSSVVFLIIALYALLI